MIDADYAVPPAVAGPDASARRRSGRDPARAAPLARCRSTGGRWDEALDDLEAGRLHASILGRDDYPDTSPAESMLLIQAIHHGNDHRTQICSTLGALDLELPELDGWDFWADQHRTT